ncbi:nuclear receptor coactivator 7 isoform X2 [Neocloeon triangulifer]|uniref:nuclear receptor coactivator 7 isoform X2 n=1 Tax=Neocloeon triangulifer TaxID=2078957 RepID=UPI00286EFCC6|nr:nuclear receptor coactivator 7 isoform X2 [Neocloeon triangulifer]
MKSVAQLLAAPPSGGAASTPGRRQSAWDALPASQSLLDEAQQQQVAKRRKSWHHRLERRRRKGVVVAVGGADPHAVAAIAANLNCKPKRRSSWWNFFGADHWPRSKSRSVDHGLLMSFDLNSLRSKVEGRIEAVQGDDPPPPPSNDEGSSNEGGNKEPRVAAKIVQPSNTTTYTVKANDTLTSVAACYDTTPGELAKLNKLPQRLPLFPGQLLFVPLRDRPAPAVASDAPDTDQNSSNLLDPENASTEPDEERDLLDSLRPASPLPGAGGKPLAEATVDAASCPLKSKKARDRFLRINVRHITDGQGVVGGVLLVTSNAVMFDPNVSDPLVIEHGPESYGVIAPMEFVVNAAIYHDIAHMRVRRAPGEAAPPTPTAKPIIYRPEGEVEGDKEGSPSKDECFPELRASTSTSPSNSPASLCSSEPPNAKARDGDAFPKAFERDLVTPTVPPDSAAPASAKPDDRTLTFYDSGIDMRDSAGTCHATEPIAEEEVTCGSANPEGKAIATVNRKKVSSVSLSTDTPSSDAAERPERSKGFKRLSYPLSWVEGPGSCDKDSLESSQSQPNSADLKEHLSVFSKVFSRRSSMDASRKAQKLDLEAERASAADSGAKLNYHSMVSVEDMPELFVSFEKLIPRPARPSEDPPMYLRLLMGKPINKRVSKSTPIMSYGKKKMRPEYWFSVPRNRVDDLYQFIQVWVPHLYGDIEEMDLAERGFELVDSDTELWPEEAADADHKDNNRGSTSSAGELGELTRESWEVLKAPYVKFYTLLKTQTISSECEARPEVLSMSEELRRALYAAGGSTAGSFDLDVFGLPELIGTTEILTDGHRLRLLRHLPARAEGYPWTLVFSTSQHGFSLNSMFRKMAKVDSPILVVVQDTENHVFGAMTSCALKVSDHFYGTGESFLFRFVSPAATEAPPVGKEADAEADEAKPVTSPSSSPQPSKLEVFDWTGENIFFIKGNNESLAIGSGEGKFGLWLDGDLYQGRTQACSTYGNAALVDGEDFVVKTLECWAFV